MLFHHITISNVRPGDHLYRWHNLRLSQGIAVQLIDNTSEIFVVMSNEMNTFRLVPLCEFKGKGILRRVLYDQGDSYLHWIKFSGTSFIEKKRPAEEVVQNALLLFETANKNPKLTEQLFIGHANNFAQLCCTMSHEDWRNKLLEHESRLSSNNNHINSIIPTDVHKMKELEDKIQILEDQQCCPICLDKSSNVAFLCGHVACFECAQTLIICHSCRRDIHQRIQIYF